MRFMDYKTIKTKCPTCKKETTETIPVPVGVSPHGVFPIHCKRHKTLDLYNRWGDPTDNNSVWEERR